MEDKLRYLAVQTLPTTRLLERYTIDEYHDDSLLSDFQLFSQRTPSSMPLWSEDKTELNVRWDSRNHLVQCNHSYQGNHDMIMLYGSQVGVRIDSSGKKHRGTLTIQFLDPHSIPITYSLWLATWSQEIHDTMATLNRALDAKPMERLLLRPENFGIALSMEQFGREADIFYYLVCIPNDKRCRSSDECCLRYNLQPCAREDEWQLVQVAGGKKEQEVEERTRGKG